MRPTKLKINNTTENKAPTNSHTHINYLQDFKKKYKKTCWNEAPTYPPFMQNRRGLKTQQLREERNIPIIS